MTKRSIDQEFDVETQIKKDYTVISAKKRENLIALVMTNGMTIYKASKRLGIKHPTAKSIIKSFRKSHQTNRPSQKITKDADQGYIHSNQHQCPSEKQQKQIKRASSATCEIASQPYLATFPSYAVIQYSYLWSSYQIYHGYSQNYS